MTYTSDLSNGMDRYCLFMSQTKVVRLSPGAYVLCVGIVQYFNDVLHWCMCPFGAEGKKRTVYLS